jgi:hypothetical protein
MISIRFEGWLSYILIGVVALGLSLWLFVLNSMRQLPWQSPLLDTEMPKSLPPVGRNGVLIFSKTNGFRHESIEAGIAALKKAAAKQWDCCSTRALGDWRLKKWLPKKWGGF